MSTWRGLTLALGVGIWLVPAGPARAQDAATTVRPFSGGIWSARVENDKFTTLPLGSDKYYTNGLEAAWTSDPGRVPEVLDRLAGLLWGDGQRRWGLGISQQIYTPTNTGTATPNPHDRPLAGYLAGTISLSQDSGNHRDQMALSVGVIGPSAFGRQVQNGWHSFIHVAPNRGWDKQMPDEPVLQLVVGRTWRLPMARLGGLETDALPSLTAGVGTLRDYVQTGLAFRLGQGLDADFGPARIRPGLSGGNAYNADAKLAWYVFLAADGQAVARDALLDGDIFSHSAHVGHKRAVAELLAGAAIIWHGVRLSYTQTWQTEQFNGQKAGLFNFGSLTASARF
ncbi:MAG: lipid A deacylase LpxR family protein [Rhodospirillales bacterium]|nr:lipid A deacylase LpxR family protein [Rhodospirillales bacterium]